MVACIYSPLIKNPKRVSNEFMHVTDLLPTLAEAAQIKITDKSLDGMSQWDTITNGSPSPRQELLYNVENIFGYSALMSNGYKIVNGTENIKNANWFGSSGTEFVNVSFKSYVKDVLESDASKSLPQLDFDSIKELRNVATVKCVDNRNANSCDPLKAPCLFNIIEDPCEQNNLAGIDQVKLNVMRAKLEVYIQETIPTRRRFTDDNCDPINFNNTWNWWQEDTQKEINIDWRIRNYYIIAWCALLLICVLTLTLINLRSKNNGIRI